MGAKPHKEFPIVLPKGLRSFAKERSCPSDWEGQETQSLSSPGVGSYGICQRTGCKASSTFSRVVPLLDLALGRLSSSTRRPSGLRCGSCPSSSACPRRRGREREAREAEARKAEAREAQRRQSAAALHLRKERFEWWRWGVWWAYHGKGDPIRTYNVVGHRHLLRQSLHRFLYLRRSQLGRS